MKKYYNMQVIEFLREVGEVLIGYSVNNQLICDDCISICDADRIIEECETFFYNYNQYNEIYHKVEPNDITMELYEVITDYKVNSYSMCDDGLAIECIWVNK